ncbi:MAG: hypothetical protein WDN66_04990 [Candidatus Saccharibacteria bacterium]
MSKNSEVLSLAELQGYRSDSLAWNLELPEYVPSDQIGVDVNLLRRVAYIGGIKHLRVGLYDGDRANTTQSVVGLSQDGTAVGGMSAVDAKADEVKTEVTDAGDHFDKPYSEYWWG